MVGGCLLLAWPWLRAPHAVAIGWDAAAAAGMVLGVLFWGASAWQAVAACGLAVGWLVGCEVLGLPGRLGMMPMVVALPVLAALRRAGPGCAAEARVAGAGAARVAVGVVAPLAVPGVVAGLGLALAGTWLPAGWAVVLAGLVACVGLPAGHWRR